MSDQHDAVKDMINQYYHVVDVTEKGINYILMGLRYGRTLSNLTARYLSIENGKVATFVDRSIDVSSLSDFEGTWVGRSLPGSLQTLLNEGLNSISRVKENFFVVPTIQNFLTKNSQNICIIEHPDAKPTDSWTKVYLDDPFVIFGHHDVYYFIDNSAFDATTILNVLSAATSWTVKAFLTTLPENVTLKLRQEIDLDFLEILAKNTKMIIMGAYDEEGYVIWSISE